MKIKVNKIYQTIQGEGPNMGRPAVFIELTDKGKGMTVEQILEILLKTKPSKLLVIKGKEPMEQMHELSGTLKSLFFKIKRSPQFKHFEIEVETSGTIPLTENMYWITDSFTIKPTSFTQNSAILYDQFWNVAKDIITLKLMIKTKEDLEIKGNWIKNLVKAPMKAHDIFLIPDSSKDKEIKEIAKWLVPVCVNEGFRFGITLRNWLKEE